jgi:hypothetical protein
MKMIDFTAGVWLIETVFGGQYEVAISEVNDHKGLSFSGRYKYDLHGTGMEDIGMGTFPMEEIRSMRKISA